MNSFLSINASQMMVGQVMPPEPGEARASLVAARARAGQARTRAETQLVNLLAELLDTERIYVKDLEKVRGQNEWFVVDWWLSK